jgi:hypothetical protein
MAMQKAAIGATIVIAAIGLFLTVLTAGVLTSSQTVQSSGTITAINVGVYSDSACTQNLTSIDWGTLAPGNSTTRTIYIKNTGTDPVTLSMTTSSWVPSNANTYLTLTWNRANYVLNANTSVSATLTLTASASAGALTTFSFNIVITGTA